MIVAPGPGYFASSHDGGRSGPMVRVTVVEDSLRGECVCRPGQVAGKGLTPGEESVVFLSGWARCRWR